MIPVPIISAALSAHSAHLLLQVPSRHPSEWTPTGPSSTKYNFLCWILKTFPTMSPFGPTLFFFFFSALCTFSVQCPKTNGLPWWLRHWRICLQCQRPGFNPWVRKIPWRREWKPIPVSLLGESPWTEEPGRLQSTELQRVRHNWAIKHYPHGAILKWWFPTLNAHQNSLGIFSKEMHMPEPHCELRSLSAVAWVQTLVSSKAPLHFPWPW